MTYAQAHAEPTDAMTDVTVWPLTYYPRRLMWQQTADELKYDVNDTTRSLEPPLYQRLNTQFILYPHSDAHSVVELPLFR